MDLTSSQAVDYVAVAPGLDRVARFSSDALAAFTERHHARLPIMGYTALAVPPVEALMAGAGAVLVLDRGLPGSAQLKLARALVSRGRRVFLYWPAENAVEVVGAERLASLRRHRLAFVAASRFRAWRQRRRDRAAGAAVSSAAMVGMGIRRTDSNAALSMIEQIGEESSSLQIHLEGGIGELRRSAADHAVEIKARRQEAADAIGRPAAAPPSPAGTADADAGSTAARTTLDRLGESAGNLCLIGGRIADYLETGLPILERIRQQSQVAAELVRSASPTSPQLARDAGPYGEGDLSSLRAFVRAVAEDPRPVALPLESVPDESRRLPGTGVYLRLDFWAPLTSGGSYGHTCYQAEALARTTSDFVAINANRFELLDTLGVRQVVVPGRDMTQTEANILGMNRHYADRLGLLFHAMRPAYIFERAVLGSAVGAWVSRRFDIPYILEYNGSEISMKRSFAGSGYAHEELLLLAEDAAFRQATMVSVISDHVAADVARRGVPESRILVNPNAVDLEAYAPAAPEEYRRLRDELGFSDGHRVVGFIGTFGGWHGIDVLAASLSRIMAGDPTIRYLLIGDGNLKAAMTEAIVKAGVQDRVVDMGRVPQTRGAELLKACDILVSPHSRNMVDSPFFGSPTKLFEYMGMGAGIVASDLEQIAHVLSPAVRPSDFKDGAPAISDQRAVLCPPGDAAAFAEGVLALARHPEACKALGRNARAAAERYYTWDQHVRNLWLALAGRATEGYSADRRGSGA